MPDWFVLVSTIGAAFSVVANVLGAARTPRPWSALQLITAAFSLLYVGAWGWLLIWPDTDRGVWSEHVTPVSAASFFVVWGIPGLVSYFHNQTPEEVVE